MMATVNTFADFLSAFLDVVKTIRVVEILDILIVAYFIYQAIHVLRETRAAQLVKGLVIFLVAYALACFTKLQTVRFIMEYVLDNALVVVVVVFQPELRRALEQVGRSRFSNIGLFSSHADDEELLRQRWKNAIDAICESASSLSRTQTGALMVIERQTKLGDIIKTGTIIDSDPSLELIGNIFFPNSPLHDGAMIIRGGRLHAAGCFLPLSANYEISKQLGTRHRAALGMSENSDALVVVVSEETGYISVTRDGVLTRNITVEQLRETLQQTLLKKEDKDEDREKKSVFKRVKK